MLNFNTKKQQEIDVTNDILKDFVKITKNIFYDDFNKNCAGTVFKRPVELIHLIKLTGVSVWFLV